MSETTEKTSWQAIKGLSPAEIQQWYARISFIRTLREKGYLFHPERKQWPVST